MGIGLNINKAKDIAHEVRRAKRAEEFAPLDIKATIPAEAAAAEAARQQVRDKYAAMQTAIDAAATPEEIKAAAGL
jgi:CRISPR/Cas system CSM-associated protein Csm2 small subunit